jgi:23S rRNA (adenine2503-C2)-methyltransferase
MTAPAASSSSSSSSSSKMINLHTIPQEELEAILKSWGHPKYRAQQIWNWVRVQGVTNVDDMQNIPKKLKQQLKDHAAVGSLELDTELVSKDGTIKRAYRLADGQLIESVLMPYHDGRYTACISSQAGCAQGCVFCATGQMGFSRQLTSDEIFEQVARFASELALQEKQEAKDAAAADNDDDDADDDNHLKRTGRQTRLSNIVFMGMGEPLANYRNVKAAVSRIQSELGIGHRKITISTVGIVPNIRKMAKEMPQVRLAVSLHCASDEERSALLPANERFGGLDELMQSLQDYITITKGKRLTLEWALIEGENDTPETAHKLGKLIKKWLRRDLIHVNVIPLNPTGGYGGSPSGRQRVNTFCDILDKQYGVACTPRVRRGIDINAGCGQLASEIGSAAEKRDDSSSSTPPEVVELSMELKEAAQELVVDMQQVQVEPTPRAESEQQNVASTVEIDETNGLNFVVDESSVAMEDGVDWEDYEYKDPKEQSEASRLVSLVKGAVISAENAVVGSPPKASK